ncbi:MAG: hypothetical protein RMJ52_04195 [Gemmataceae bacterium]|nr:hypothetical protein [Gemmataceae bacterium]
MELRPRQRSFAPLWLTLAIVTAGAIFLAGVWFWYRHFPPESDGLRAKTGGRDSRAFTPALLTAQAFLQDLSEGRVRSAYNRSTADFRDRHTPELFQALYDESPVLHRHAPPQLREVERGVGHVTYKGTLQGPNGRCMFTLRVVYEDDEWRIDRFEYDGGG